jgi:hypothetical protein
MRLLSLLLPLLLHSSPLAAATLHVGPGQPYPTLPAAVAVVQPGDTVEIHAGTYPGGLAFTNLKGLPGAWITLRAAAGETVIFEGGGNAIQFVEPAYLHVKGLTFRHQTGNGVNTDDGGTFNTPAHHVVFEDCIFRDMNASGNNDLLKLSGLDSFEVRGCQFINGAEGGSGVDMVGCHYGRFTDNYFENMGSNSIQCKGGSEHIRFERNFFRDGGQRALNLGGSTGLQFFRPDTAHFEAANLQVFSNIFVGSWAPIAYVGSVGVEVVNNTFYQPEHWVIRILQETVDPDRFVECGDNSFVNNIVYLSSSVVTETNVGPNTRPETFLFSHNLWFNADDPGWAGPDLPVAETNGLINQDPLFADAGADDFHLSAGSPAIGAGAAVAGPEEDFYEMGFGAPRSIGAVEGNLSSGTGSPADQLPVTVFPNPATDRISLHFAAPCPAPLEIKVSDGAGRILREWRLPSAPGGRVSVYLGNTIPAGMYWMEIRAGGKSARLAVIKH